MLEFIKDTVPKKALYRCHCGNTVEALRSNVVRGNTKSCGCLKKLPYAKKHGYTSDREVPKVYYTWKSMRNRCNNPNRENSKYYIEKGITCCERWNSFENFLADMGEPESKNMTLDRIDNSLGYSKENCRWVSMKVQNLNKGNNVRYEYQGKNQTLSEWAEELGIKRLTLFQRIKRGATIEEAFSSNLKEDTVYTFDGKSLTLSAWERELGIGRKTLAARLQRGIPIDIAFSTKGYLKVNR